MIDLSEKTIEIIKILFPLSQQGKVEELLKVECADDIPFCENHDKYNMERIRFSVLKLSERNMGKLVAAIELAKTDWRDLFMAAGFGFDTNAHKKWNP